MKPLCAGSLYVIYMFSLRSTLYIYISNFIPQLSVHLEIYPEELSQALTHIGVESKQPDQYNKNLALTGVLKCYIDYLKEGIPNIQELIKDADHRSCASETEVLVDVKDGITLGSGKHLKRLVESELRCLRSKPNQASIDGISDAIRRLDLAMVIEAATFCLLDRNYRKTN
jgi:hypothetical protein